MKSLKLPTMHTGLVRKVGRSIKFQLAIGLVVFASSLVILNNSLGPAPAHVVTTPHASAVAQTKPMITGEPVRLQIPSLNMDLQIVDGYYNAKTKAWTLSHDKVQFATLSTQPNNKSGNTFLYGHYRREVFANLHKIQANAEAIVTTSNGHIFDYRLNAVKVVDPADVTGIFDYQGKPIMTVQTCTGPLFESRQLFVFDLIQVD